VVVANRMRADVKGFHPADVIEQDVTEYPR